MITRIRFFAVVARVRNHKIVRVTVKVGNAIVNGVYDAMAGTD